jgi:hypothetical protein
MWLGQTFWGKYANKVRLLLFLNVINLKKTQHLIQILIKQQQTLG